MLINSSQMRLSNQDNSTTIVPPGEAKNLNSELWHACAGPLVSLPAVGSHVVYLPQGHSEQVAASTQKEVDGHIPAYPNLPPQLVCHLNDIILHADKETDEVYCQMILQPVMGEPYCVPDLDSPSRQPNIFFCKTLTTSDTSTHGGFSIPRRAAEKVFPSLDYTQQPPVQELIAQDLHGNEWKFRHIYRGQPKRHLLTTGWSVFVSAKRLLAGDSVLFIRNEKGKLLLGIRRTTRPQTVMPSFVLSSDSMHIGVLAAAAHAANTNSRFTVFYNPRASPSPFVIPFSKFERAIRTHVSVGMRFRMLFETEESSVRRFMGFITGMSDLDPVRWPNSYWRSIKVGWDESSAGDRQRRASLWEIEPLTTFLVYPQSSDWSLKDPWPQPIMSGAFLGDLGVESLKRSSMWMDFQSNNNEINTTLTPSSQSRSELIHGELQQNLPSKHSTFQQQQNKSFYADPINYRAHPNPQQPLPSLPQQHFQMQTHSETQTHTQIRQQIQLQPQYHSQFQLQYQPQLHLQPNIQLSQFHPHPYPSYPQLQIQSQSPSQAQSQPQLQSQSQLQSQPQNQSEPQVQPQFQSQPHVQPQLQSQPQIQSQPKVLAQPLPHPETPLPGPLLETSNKMQLNHPHQALHHPKSEQQELPNSRDTDQPQPKPTQQEVSRPHDIDCSQKNPKQEHNHHHQYYHNPSISSCLPPQKYNPPLLHQPFQHEVVSQESVLEREQHYPKAQQSVSNNGRGQLDQSSSHGLNNPPGTHFPSFHSQASQNSIVSTPESTLCESSVVSSCSATSNTLQSVFGSVAASADTDNFHVNNPMSIIHPSIHAPVMVPGSDLLHQHEEPTSWISSGNQFSCGLMSDLTEARRPMGGGGSFSGACTDPMIAAASGSPINSSLFKDFPHDHEGDLQRQSLYGGGGNSLESIVMPLSMQAPGPTSFGDSYDIRGSYMSQFGESKSVVSSEIDLSNCSNNEDLLNRSLDDPFFLRAFTQASAPVRTYTKIYKSGSVGRSLDVTRFSNYDELRSELARLFGLQGQLEDPKSGWKLIFKDKENDWLLLGDDPWEAFINNVRSIKILSPLEQHETALQSNTRWNDVAIKLSVTETDEQLLGRWSRPTRYPKS